MNNLRNLRKARGYTIKQLSELIGVPTRTIEDWEAERRQIMYYHRIKALAYVLDCSTDELMTKEEKCIYDGINVKMCLVQSEQGVDIEIVEQKDFDILFETMVTREIALALLECIKVNKNEDIQEFLELHGQQKKYRNKTE